jgi:hypothetical protein
VRGAVMCEAPQLITITSQADRDLALSNEGAASCAL